MGRGRPKQEPTRLRSIRLPERLWVLVDRTVKNNYRSVNALIRKLVEDHLADKDLLDQDK